MNDSPLRVLHDPPLPGAENMARDEALLIRVGHGDSPATLRFYQWNPPTISLGYFQKYAEYAQLPPPAGELAVVRRQTGGGAILHDRELTYSIVVPQGHALLAGGPNCLYQLAHQGLIEALTEANCPPQPCGFTDDSGPARGPFFCFARRHKLDVVVGQQKLVGSAQRRTREAVLQHGSIVLERRFDQQPAATVSAIAEVSAEELARRMTDALRGNTGLSFVPGEWKAEELADAKPLVAKHTGDEWLKRI